VSLGFDASPLTDPLDPAAVKAFARTERAQQKGRTVSATASTIVMTVVAVVFFGFMAVFLTFFFGSLIRSAASANGAIAAVPLLMAVVPIVIIVIVGLLIWRTWANRRRRIYRLAHFARANGMRYFTTIADPKLPGMIFGIGRSRKVLDAVRGDKPRFVEFGNYQFTTGSGKSQQTHRWGYIAVKLNTPLPHIVLDATGNNSFLGSNLPISFKKDQRLSLEGDFDQHFDLYCPTGYERDALYLFTPDIMARFIDNAAQLDVEIVDDWMFLYMRRDVVGTSPATWAWLFSVVHALLGKLDQWERWRDDRLRSPSIGDTATGQLAAAAMQHPGAGAGLPGLPTALTPPPIGVANDGRRLRRGVVIWPILIIGAIVLFQFARGILNAL